MWERKHLHIKKKEEIGSTWINMMDGDYLFLNSYEYCQYWSDYDIIVHTYNVQMNIPSHNSSKKNKNEQV